jgi:hypothetical protein
MSGGRTGILKKVSVEKIDVNRPRDHPRQRWVNRLKHDLNRCVQKVTMVNSTDNKVR